MDTLGHPWILAGNKYILTERCCIGSFVSIVHTNCVSVCLSVSELSHGWSVWPRITKFGAGIDVDDISAKFDGQGHRSKVKVARLKNMIFRLSSHGVTYVNWTEPFCHDTWRHVTSRHDITERRHDVTAWRLDILWWFLGKNTDKEGMSREGASTLRRFHYS